MSAAIRRKALLDAGYRLAEKISLDELNAPALSAEAGLQPTALIEQFVNLDQYIVFLQQYFMDELRERVLAATNDLPPGIARVNAGVAAYLDGCLARRGLRGWFMHERRQKPEVAEGLRKQNLGYVLILSAEFAALRWPHPQSGARLLLAVLLEAARIEHSAGRASPELRSALWNFLRTYEGKS